MPIKYVEGDLFEQMPNDGIIIPHIVNDILVFGAGFVLPLTRCFPKAKTEYLAWEECALGHTQFVECSNTKNKAIVANMCAQKGVGRQWIDGKEVPPIRYEPLRNCMFDVKKKVAKDNLKIVCPMFGSGLSQGDWNKIEGMIYEIWNEYDVTIYYFPQFLPKNFNPVNRTDKDILQRIRDKEKRAIDTCNVIATLLSKSVAMIEYNPWPHTNRNCDIHAQEALAALKEATNKVEALKSTLVIQEIQEKHFE